MKITAVTRDEFIDQFKMFLKQSECASIQNIVYFWKSETPVPRVIGESNILYIGQTSKSLNIRYGCKKDLDSEAYYFENVYQHVIQKYGSIFMEIRAVDNPKYSEWEELNNYYSAHREFPPLNRAFPNKPSTNA
jgi:hypothetical protein